MIKSDNEKIEVYTDTNEELMMEGIGALLLTPFLLWLITNNITAIFLITLLSISIFLCLMAVHKKEPPKLTVVLTKNYIEVFEEEGIFRCNMDKIFFFGYSLVTGSR